MGTAWVIKGLLSYCRKLRGIRRQREPKLFEFVLHVLEKKEDHLAKNNKHPVTMNFKLAG